MMRKRNNTKRQKKFHLVHLLALALLVGYFTFSKVNTVHALSSGDFNKAFLQVYVYGIFFGCLFLYLFSHEKFFPVAKDIEKQEEKTEKAYLKKYLKGGKVLSTFIIGVIGGPVFSSLTARLLLNKYWYKYLVVILANVPSTLFTVGIGHSILKFVGLA